VANKLDTRWFDLKKYSAVADFTLFDWEYQLDIRHNLNNIILCHETNTLREAVEWIINHIKTTPANRLTNQRLIPGAALSRLRQHSFDTYSVNNTTTTDIHRMGNDPRLRSAWAAIERIADGARIKGDGELAKTPYDLLKSKSYYGNIANITVDLTATDEQIKKDFAKWLLEYRKTTRYKLNPAHTKIFKTFNDSVLKDWEECCVLPYIDLDLMAKLEGKKITLNEIDGLIFPKKSDEDRAMQTTKPRLLNKEVDDRARRTTKPRAEWLMRNETLTAIKSQLKGA
jgi:hypothetical protein